VQLNGCELSVAQMPVFSSLRPDLPVAWKPLLARWMALGGIGRREL